MKIFPVLALLLAFGNLHAQFCIPEIVVMNGVATNLIPADTNGEGFTDDWRATIRVSDLFMYANSPCGAGPLQKGIVKSTMSTGFFPTDTVVTFDCTEEGPQIVQVWVKDQQGNANYAETYVYVQSPHPGCGTPAPSLPVSDCSTDQIPGQLVVYNGFTVNPTVAGKSNDKATLRASQFVRAFRDNCGPAQGYYISLADDSFTGLPNKTAITLKCNNQGIVYLRIYAKDAHGNWSSAETYVRVEDNVNACNTPITLAASCANDEYVPSGILFNGLATSLRENGQFTIWATDFVFATKDNCTSVNTTDIRIRKSGLGNTPPSTTSVTFTCNELGFQYVDIWFADQAGNWNMLRTYVIIQDNWGICGQSPKPERAWPAELDAYIKKKQ